MPLGQEEMAREIPALVNPRLGAHEELHLVLPVLETQHKDGLSMLSDPGGTPASPGWAFSPMR